MFNNFSPSFIFSSIASYGYSRVDNRHYCRYSRNYYNGRYYSGVSIRRGILTPFFIKPRLEVSKQPEKYHVPVTIFGKRDVVTVDSKEIFEANIWNLKITNKHHRLSRMVKKCSPKIYIDIIGEEVGLSWKPPVQTNFKKMIIIEEIPHFDDNESIKAEFVKRFCNEYAYNTLLGIVQTDIPTDESKEIYFLFTFKESNFAYLIVPYARSVSEHNGVLVEHINEAPLLLKIPGEYSFRIRFEGEQYSEENGHKLKLNIKSYDEIKIT